MSEEIGLLRDAIDRLAESQQKGFERLEAAMVRHADDDSRTFASHVARMGEQDGKIDELKTTAIKAHVWGRVGAALGGILSAAGITWFGWWLKDRGGHP